MANLEKSMHTKILKGAKKRSKLRLVSSNKSLAGQKPDNPLAPLISAMEEGIGLIDKHINEGLKPWFILLAGCMDEYFESKSFKSIKEINEILWSMYVPYETAIDFESCIFMKLVRFLREYDISTGNGEGNIERYGIKSGFTDVMPDDLASKVDGKYNDFVENYHENTGEQDPVI